MTDGVRFTSKVVPFNEWRGRKVTVMGLGLFGGGRGVAEFFCRWGADVTVTDRRGARDLRPSVQSLDKLPIRWVLGTHREEDFLAADLVVASPAIPRTSSLLQLASRAGVAIETETNLFFKYCRGKICGVTGSNGKTTTTRLLGEMVRRRWPHTRVGGNLGRSLLPDVDSISTDEWVVMELSSFQLEDLRAIDQRPEIAVVTNLSPNHLDRHGTYENYVDAKAEILPRLRSGVAVLNAEDALVRAWSGRASCRLSYFGRAAPQIPERNGMWIVPGRNSTVVWQKDKRQMTVFRASDLRLPGAFNLLNAAAAAAAAAEMGVDAPDVRRAVRDFAAVEHRLEPVREVGGVRFINDSVSTTPESTIAALNALRPHAVLICGGSSKGCSFHALGRAIQWWTRGVVALGETADSILRAVPRRPGSPPVRHAADLDEAVRLATQLASPGDSIVLSPACPSYDMFVNFEARGREFKRLVAELSFPGSRNPSEVSFPQ